MLGKMESIETEAKPSEEIQREHNISGLTNSRIQPLNIQFFELSILLNEYI